MKSGILKGYLLLAGTVMMVVGSYMAITTAAYLATMTTPDVPASINLLSDLRGMGGVLLILGGYVLMSTFRITWQNSALVISITVYASFVIFRSLGFVLDGFPDTAIMTAYMIEAILAIVGVILIKRNLSVSG